MRTSLVLLERLAATGLRGIKVPPKGSKERWHPRIIPVNDLEEYRHQVNRIHAVRRALGVSFFLSEQSEKCLEMDDAVFKLAVNNKEVVFVRLNVDEPGVEEITQTIEVPLLPTFYFYKAGTIVGRLIGTSVPKLEDLVVSFIHHRELRYHIRLNEF